MTAIRKQLSYANVMATLAVFIALGGGRSRRCGSPPTRSAPSS